jgi:hypothetical protein
MQFELQSPKTITIRPAETVELSTVSIERVLDDPVHQKVIVWLRGLQHPVELGSLSGENYDNPQWTNESLLQAVTDFVSTLS